MDTVRIDSNGETVSIHGNFLLTKTGQVQKMEILDERSGRTEDGRHVMQQQATRSCVPTAVAMLLMDRNSLTSEVDEAVSRTNLANDDDAVRWIEGSGKMPVVLSRPEDRHPLEFLSNQLSSYGSGIVSITHPQGGGHVIVLDKIDLKKKIALIRDPYHGLSLEISLNEFMSWKPEGFIGVRSAFREIPASERQFFHPRETRLQRDPSVVQRKLRKEKKAAAAQQEKQENSPVFRVVPSRFSGKNSSKQELVNGRPIGIAHDQGRRGTMEDEDLAVSGRAGAHSYELYAIFDGHGGDQTAKFLKGNLQKYVHEELKKMKGSSDLEIWNALKSACVLCDDALKSSWIDSGSTGVIALRLNGDLWIANVGDSRAVWRKKDGTTIQLSEDAKPNDPKYKRSIEKRGGSVIYNQGFRVNGNLAVARSFNDATTAGDEYFCISARPKIVKVEKGEIEPGDFLVLTCDGVPDVASSDDIGERAAQKIQECPEAAALHLVGGAYSSGSGDNLSAMVIPL
jgi:serine/threonine protein phosphatase PrpC